MTHTRIRFLVTRPTWDTEDYFNLPMDPIAVSLDVDDEELVHDAKERAVATLGYLVDSAGNRVHFTVSLGSDQIHRENFPAFGRREDGSVFSTTLSQHDTTFGDIRRACQAGILTGDWRTIVLLPTEGMGGDGGTFDLVIFLAENGIQIIGGGLLAWFANSVGKLLPTYLRKKILRRSAREVIASWANNRMDSPWVLTKFLESREEWTVRLLASSLKVSPRTAVELLQATGHARRIGTDTWVEGRSPDSIKRRQEWDSATETTFTADYGHTEYLDGTATHICKRCHEPMTATITSHTVVVRCPRCSRTELLDIVRRT